MSTEELPEKLYLERWPAELDREDSIHYQPTGCGIDMRTGATSEITVYVKESPRAERRARHEQAAERRGRIAELEDLIERRQVTLDMPTAAALSVRLAQLRAEEKR